MQSSDLIKPLAIGSAIAAEADSDNKKIPPQEATSGVDTSCISEGFLEITSEPLDDGGVAPERIDFNGMFYLATDQRVFLQNGGVITYDADVATKIGGYPQGAILGYITSNSYGFVKSLINNNTNNFVSNPSYIDGVNWEYIPLTNTLETIKLIYPVGSLYIGLTQTCPLASLFGTWELITSGLTLQQANTDFPVGTEIPAGLPNLYGSFALDNKHWLDGYLIKSVGDRNSGATGDNGLEHHVEFNASNYNSIYGNSDTVQPPALAVNIWRRTA